MGRHSRRAGGDAPILAGVDLEVRAGERLGLVGESGSGKTTCARALAGIVSPELEVCSGSVWLEGAGEVLCAGSQPRRACVPGVAMIPQDAIASLNPYETVLAQLVDNAVMHGVARERATDTAVRSAHDVGLRLDEAGLSRRPHEFSGGMRQRLAIAMALAVPAKLLIADEPTTSLDAVNQEALLDLLAQLCDERGMALLYISHNLGLVSRVCETVAVMHDGLLVERGAAGEVLGEPHDAYTRRLVAATRDLLCVGERGLGAVGDHVPAAAGVVDEPELALGDHAADGTFEPLPAPASPAGGAAPGLAGGEDPLLVVEGLAKTYRHLGLGRTRQQRHATAGVSFAVRPGEVLGIVGESGSGKSTVCKMVMGLLRPDEGSVTLQGTRVDTLRPRERRRLWGRVQMVFQDPFSCFDPRVRVGDSLAEPLVVHGLARGRAAALEQLGPLLVECELDAEVLGHRPAELSGGQLQRLSIVRALSVSPKLLVADEVVSALDTCVQDDVLALLERLIAERGLGMLFVSHDLAVIRRICSHVIVMREGQVVDEGDVAHIFGPDAHEYTKSLVRAVPQLA